MKAPLFSEVSLFKDFCEAVRDWWNPPERRAMQNAMKYWCIHNGCIHYRTTGRKER